jgi:hypothetical protein
MEPVTPSTPRHQTLGYPRAFGLLDNPFNPQEFRGISGALLDGLFEKPIALDEELGLEPLFVSNAGPFQQHLQVFKSVLTAGGYQSGVDPKSVLKSFAFRVIGPKGSGKSTMTNKMIAWLKGCFTDTQMAKHDLRVLERKVSPLRIESTLADVRKLAEGQRKKWCCLALDDVRLDTEDELHELYDELRDESVAVIMFEILHHAETLRGELPEGRVQLYDLRTSGLDGDQANAFLTERIRIFRDSAVNGNLGTELANYPFNPDQVAEVVGSGATLTLRTLNRVLNSALVNELGPRTLSDDVAQLTAAELRERLIDVVAVYEGLRSSGAGT